jgi:hypothetical protein
VGGKDLPRSRSVMLSMVERPPLSPVQTFDFENQSETYHDTQTHYLMEKEPLLLKDQDDGMDDTIVDKMEVLKKKYVPSKSSLNSIWLLVLHV